MNNAPTAPFCEASGSPMETHRYVVQVHFRKWDNLDDYATLPEAITRAMYFDPSPSHPLRIVKRTIREEEVWSENRGFSNAAGYQPQQPESRSDG